MKKDDGCSLAVFVTICVLFLIVYTGMYWSSNATLSTIAQFYQCDRWEELDGVNGFSDDPQILCFKGDDVFIAGVEPIAPAK